MPIELIKLMDGIEVLVGVIDVATNDVETPEEMANMLREALKFVEPNKLIACTNCGMAPLASDVADAKLKAPSEGAAIVRNELVKTITSTT